MRHFASHHLTVNVSLFNRRKKYFFLQSLKDCFVNVTKNRRERNLWVFIYQNHNFISNEWKNLHYNFSHSLSTDVRKFCAAIDYFRKNESRLYPFIIFHHSFEKTKCLTTVLLLCSNELKPHPFHFLIELQNRSHVGLLVQKTFTTTFFFTHLGQQSAVEGIKFKVQVI